MNLITFIESYQTHITLIVIVASIIYCWFENKQKKKKEEK